VPQGKKNVTCVSGSRKPYPTRARQSAGSPSPRLAGNASSVSPPAAFRAGARAKNSGTHLRARPRHTRRPLSFAGVWNAFPAPERWCHPFVPFLKARHESRWRSRATLVPIADAKRPSCTQGYATGRTHAAAFACPHTVLRKETSSPRFDTLSGRVHTRRRGRASLLPSVDFPQCSCLSLGSRRSRNFAVPSDVVARVRYASGHAAGAPPGGARLPDQLWVRLA